MPADAAALTTTIGEDAAVLAQPSPLASFWAAFRENRGAVIGLAVFAVIVLLALTANVVAPHSPIEQFRDSVRTPPVWEAGGSWRFVLGTDGDGHDMLSRLIFGARVSLFIGLSVMCVSFVVGVALGLAAAMAGPVADVADHAAYGFDHGGAEPGARRACRRGSGAEPRQHHHRGDDRLSAGLRASGARLRARRTQQGLCDRRARGRRRAAQARCIRRYCQTASRRSSCRRRLACRAPSSRRRRSASLASAPSRRRRNGARCWPTRANSSAPIPGSSPFRASPSSSPCSPSI